jgi:hypothetical protein
MEGTLRGFGLFRYIYICGHICICKYRYLYIYICIYKYVYIYIYIYLYIYIYTYIYICLYIYIYIYTIYYIICCNFPINLYVYFFPYHLGLWYKLYLKIKNGKKSVFYDDDGSDVSQINLINYIDIIPIYNTLKELDTIINHVYHEEIKSGIHFLSLLIISSNKKLDYEKTMFAKFLFESRNMLSSYSIELPSSVFKSLSFHSIDVPLAAVWLSTLTQSQLDIFYIVKNRYIQKSMDKELIQDEKDNNLMLDMNTLLEDRRERETEYFDSMRSDMNLRKQQRIDHFMINLNFTEKEVVVTCKGTYMYIHICIYLYMYIYKYIHI